MSYAFFPAGMRATPAAAERLDREAARSTNRPAAAERLDREDQQAAAHGSIG